MEAGVGCLFAFVFLVGELFLFSGQFREEVAGNEVASFCAFIALIFNIVFVGILIKGIVKSAEESKERKEQERRKQIQDEISEIVSRYTLQEDMTKSNVPGIAEIDNPLVDSEVVYCVKTYIREAEEQEQKIIELRAKIQEILNYNNYATGEQNLEYLKQKEPELKKLKEELLDAQKPQDNRKIILNETTSDEMESFREAIQEISKSQKIQSMNDLEWKSMAEAPLPDELRYFKSATKPVTLLMKDYCYCIYSKTILVFTPEGKFATALDRKSFIFRVERNLEKAYFSKSQDDYPRSVAGKDSKCVEMGPERYTWRYTCRDGSRDRRYSNNYMIEYRYDTMEYGKIRLSIADITAEFKFSSEQAVLAAEKAASENEKCKVTRESNNESNIINLLQMLEPSSKSARELEERYAKLDVPQKKYCYIERS